MILNWMFPLLPGLLGGASAVLLMRKSHREVSGQTILALGTGGLLGYLCLAGVIWILNSHGLAALRVDYLKMAALLALATLTFLAWLAYRLWHLEWRHILVAAAIIPGLMLMYQAFLVPVASWDAFELWARLAAPYIEFDLGRESGEVYTRTHWRHPATVVNLSAYSGFAASQIPLQAGTLSVWWGAWLCVALAMSGAARVISGSFILSLAVFYGVSTVPLLENHVALPGYADFWVAMSVAIASALVAVGLNKDDGWLIGFGAMICMLPVTLKNTGILYSAALLLPLGFVLALRHWGRAYVASALLICAIISVALFVYGFDVTISGHRYALVRDEESVIAFGGYQMSFEIYPWKKIFSNNFHALFVNQSFSVLGTIVLVAIALYFFCGGILNNQQRSSLLFLISGTISIIAIFMLPQLVSNYAENYAEPNSDVGNSRFLLAVAPMALITLAYFPLLVEVDSRDKGSYQK